MNAPLTALDRPNSYIGRAVSRPNAVRLLAGRGRYVTDIALPRMLHCAFVRSPYAHAAIVAIETAAAAASPGVRLVASGEDLARICRPWVGTLDHFHGMKSPEQWPLARGTVTWAGQAVVAILADTRAQAEDAAELVEVAFDEKPAVTDIDAARVAGADRADERMDDNVAFHTVLTSGTSGATMASAAHVVEGTFTFGRHTPVTLEPRAIVADYEASEQRLTVHHGTQTPFQFQDLYARHYGLHEARVRVIAPDVGGSFGMKLHVYHEDMAVVGLSILAGRPVKFVADRLEAFLSDIHARDHRVTARLAIDAEGTMLAMEVDDVTAIGPFSTFPRTSVVEGNQVIRLIGAPYRFKDYRAELTVVFQNKVQTSQYRAVGHPIACAVTERLVDMAAAAIGLDPFAMRARNVVTADMYPHTSPTGYRFEALSHEEALPRLRALMDYDALRADQAAARARGVYRGIGLGVFVEITNPGPAFYGIGGARISAQDGAVVTVTPLGEVRCAISVTEQGQARKPSSPRSSPKRSAWTSAPSRC